MSLERLGVIGLVFYVLVACLNAAAWLLTDVLDEGPPDEDEAPGV